MGYFEKCCVKGCSSISNSSTYKNISWFRLPTEEQQRRLWIAAARLDNVSAFQSSLMRVCSLHFKPSDIHSEDVKKGELKDKVVPSRFPWFDNYLVQSIQISDGRKDGTPQEAGASAEAGNTAVDTLSSIANDVTNGLVQKRMLTSDSTQVIKKMKKDEEKENHVKLYSFSGVSREELNATIKSVIEELLKAYIATRYDNEFKSTWNNLICERKQLEECIRKNDAEFGNCVKFVNSGKGRLKINNNVSNGLMTGANHSSTLMGGHNMDGRTASDELEIVKMVPVKGHVKLPPVGSLKIEPIGVNSRVYGMKKNLFDKWLKATIVSEKRENDKMLYKVNFEQPTKPDVKLPIVYHTGKELACLEPSNVRLQFGKRVIALYKPSDGSQGAHFYAGIIAEPLKITNRYRYLIFFDDGFCQYVDHQDVRVVYEQSHRVWEDVHELAREFTQTYVNQYPERPMLKLQKGQVIRTERHGQWLEAKVLAVDGSMVKVQFPKNKFEWIYRGSTRLHLLYKELESAKMNRMTGRGRRHNITRRTANNQPYVEYTRNIDEIVIDSDSESEDQVGDENSAVVRRNVARKSTTQATKLPSAGSRRSHQKEGEIRVEKMPNSSKLKYRKHKCDLRCLKDNNIAKYKGKNPLCMPIYTGFQRLIYRHRYRGMHLDVAYQAPCGRSLRSLDEVMQYLSETESLLTIDLFSFDPELFPFQYFQTTKDETLWAIDDVTEGKENIPIPCVNCLKDEKPPYVEYATERFAGKGVTLNLDKEFLCGCDCTDNCQDSSKCKCQQLTITAANKEVGYQYRRLKDPVLTGIYECNEWCSCNSSCMNRVVQHGLKIRLQMFQTEKKGWGIRCVDDVDAGMFLCIYAGQLLTEQGADEYGNQYGDAYLAELDHIEVVEKHKEGYEADIPIDIDMDDEEIPKPIIKDDVVVKEQSNEEEEEEEEDEDDDESSSSSSSSDSEADVLWQQSDSDYEDSIASSNYTTRSRKEKFQKKKSFLKDIESETKKEHMKIAPPVDLDLEDRSLRRSGQSLTFKRRELSPETEERLQSLHLAYKPTFGAKHSSAKKLSSSRTPVLPPPPSLEEKKPAKFMSIRDYYKEDYCYIMDARSKGNIGRYLNHSCSPNCFVQNVFVDTHDVRFPTVAFFASERIKAGTELTWDYNYEVGSVEGKVLHCHCESRNCRGRLL